MPIELTLTTPAVLFSAISLLLLAYTNRFLAIANLIRTLYAKYTDTKSELIRGQIQNLKKRVYIIRSMQFAGISSLFLCVLSMFLIYVTAMLLAEIVFGVALILLIISLALSGWEINISVQALELHLKELKEKD
ncbi:MAG: DUF2721 domain-containing protein [Bacteroidia bacterium]